MPYADSPQRQLPYQSGSETSYDAAVAAGAFDATQRERYAAWLRGTGEQGGTDAEAERELRMRRSSVCARRNELVASGDVVKVIGRRRDGCQVWKAA